MKMKRNMTVIERKKANAEKDFGICPSLIFPKG